MRRASLLVFAAAFLTGIFYLPYLASHPRSDYSEEERIAIHLTHGDGFATPYDLSPSAPLTAWCRPVYPLLIAAIYKSLGVRTPAAIMSILLLNMLFRAFAATALFRLGQILFSPLTGLIAAALLLINPIFLQSAAMPWDNTLALALFLWITIAALYLRLALSTQHSALFGLGLSLGLLLLTNTAYALTIPAILLIATTRPANLTLAAAAVLFALLPWTLRNYADFNKLIPIHSNLYTELWQGNQPGAYGWVTPASFALHPSQNPQTRHQLLTDGEPAYFDQCRRQFFADYSADPAQFWLRCRNRLAYLFLGEPSHPFAAIHLIFATLSLAGLWCAFRLHHSTAAWMLLGLLAVVPYISTEVYDRYTLPLRAIMTLPAAFLLGHVFAYRRPSRPQASPQSQFFASFAPSR